MTPTSRPPAFISRAAALATDYVIFADAPDAAAHPGPWPIVVVLDGDYMFEPMVAQARALQAKGAIPPVLVVGIGYGKPFGSPQNYRGRDYTPTAGEEELGSGGAGRFLDYVTSQLWGELRCRYPVREDARVLAGHSLGGLFALYALFQPEPFFDRVLAGAPSLWWHERDFLAHVAHLRAAQSALNARLFLGAGEEETESMIADLALFEQQLAAAPFAGLEVISRRFSGCNHYNVLPQLFETGLQALLGDGGAKGNGARGI